MITLEILQVPKIDLVQLREVEPLEKESINKKE